MGSAVAQVFGFSYLSCLWPYFHPLPSLPEVMPVPSSLSLFLPWRTLVSCCCLGCWCCWDHRCDEGLHHVQGCMGYRYCHCGRGGGVCWGELGASAVSGTVGFMGVTAASNRTGVMGITVAEGTGLLALWLLLPAPYGYKSTTNCGNFLKSWKYQNTWPASWEICMQVKK